MMRKFKWIDLALLPFGLRVLFLLLLGKLFGLTYKQISVVFNLWVHGIAGFTKKIWLCPVTLFVLGNYPAYIYLKKTA